MLNEPDKINDDFSPALRRHLRGRVAVECSGLDADLAAAYLERALPGLACHQFEDHLAACPPCRRGLLELSQLNLLMGEVGFPEILNPDVDIPVEQPVSHHLPPVTVQVGQRLGGGFGDWFKGLDVSGWLGLRGGFSLPMIGIASAAVVLIAAGVVWQLRRVPATEFSQQLAVNNGIQSGPGVHDSPAQSAEEGAPNGILIHGREEIPGNSDSLSKNQQDQQSRQNQKDQSTMKPSVNQPTAQSDIAESGQRRSMQVVQDGNRNGSSDQKLPDLKIVVMPGLNEIPVAVASSRLAPKPEDNPMRILTLPEASNNRLAENSSQFRYGRLVGGFMPQGRARAATELTDRLNSAQVRRILDKTFTFNGHSWVDSDYLNLTTVSGTMSLSVGDANYDKLIAEFPVLREYFSLRPSVVVWRGRVYRVSGQVSGR